MPSGRNPNSLRFVAHCTLASFATYFCMYAFRKPFTVGTYEALSLWGIDYKIVLILTQVAGYTLSKFTGIKVVSEMPPSRRISMILALIGVAQVALVAFALIPPPYNFVCLFFNGLPLGMIWGIVFSFVEGRRWTEMLGAGLCTSFILSSGVVKSVGELLMVDFGVSEFWMPAATGLVFAVPLLLSVWMLSTVPPPSDEDERHRTRRVTMNAAQRRDFFLRFAPGIVTLIAVYAALNAYRDFRDNFAVELWRAVGYVNAPRIFTLSELPIAILVLVATAGLVLFKDNRRAFWAGQGTVVFGAGLVGLTTFAYQMGACDPTLWLIAVGLGMYVPYIAFHVCIFERLIALFRYESNIGYLMYLADAFGYLASVGVMLWKDFGAKDVSWLSFFVAASYATAAGCIVLIGFAMAYFRRRLARWDASEVRAEGSEAGVPGAVAPAELARRRNPAASLES